MKTRTCGARALVKLESATHIPTHQHHTCVRTDLDDKLDHLGQHVCACGESFTAEALPRPEDLPQPPQPHPWAEAVDETLAALQGDQISLRAASISMGRAIEVLSGALAKALEAMAGLEHTTHGHSASIGALEREVEALSPMTAGQAVEHGSMMAAGDILHLVQESMQAGDSPYVVMRKALRLLLHAAHGHSLDVDPDTDIATKGQAAADCGQCGIEVGGRMVGYTKARRAMGRQAFWDVVHGGSGGQDPYEGGQRDAASTISAAAVTELRAGAPIGLTLKYLLAEACHIIAGHGGPRGRACAQCLVAAGSLIDLRPGPQSVLGDLLAGTSFPAPILDPSLVFTVPSDAFPPHELDPKLMALYLIGRDDNGNVDPARSAKLDMSGPAVDDQPTQVGRKFSQEEVNRLLADGGGDLKDGD